MFFGISLFFLERIYAMIKAAMCVRKTCRGYYREENKNIHTASIRDLAVYQRFFGGKGVSALGA